MGTFLRIQVILSNGFLNSLIAQVPKIGTCVILLIFTSQISSEQPVVKIKLNSLLTKVRVTTTLKGGEAVSKVTIVIETSKSGLREENLLGFGEDHGIIFLHQFSKRTTIVP